MKIYLDDERPTPSGWVRCYWPDEVIELLKHNEVTHLSLDHDLGDDKKGTGYDVLVWLEEQVIVNNRKIPSITVHSSNPSAKMKMLSAIYNMKKPR